MTLAPQTSSLENTGSAPDLDADSLNAIRSILTEESVPAAPVRKRGRSPSPERAAQEQDAPRDVAPLRSKADALPLLQEPESEPVMPTGKASKPARRGFSLRRKAAKAQPAPSISEPAQPARPARAPRPVAENSLIARIKGYRPTAAHLAIGGFALLVLLRPWLVFGLFLLALIIMVGVFLILGYDGFWKNVMKAGRWYAARRPEHAVKLNARLDRFAMRWDAVLDRFPEGSVDGLYLPDFGELALADQRHEDAMERRLSGLSGKPS